MSKNLNSLQSLLKNGKMKVSLRYMCFSSVNLFKPKCINVVITITYYQNLRTGRLKRGKSARFGKREKAKKRDYLELDKLFCVYFCTVPFLNGIIGNFIKPL